MEEAAKRNRYPIDGMVLGYDDVAYGESLGATGHHLRSQLAFKFADDLYDLFADAILGLGGLTADVGGHRHHIEENSSGMKT